jgi:hypothetical protein
VLDGELGRRRVGGEHAHGDVAVGRSVP